MKTILFLTFAFLVLGTEAVTPCNLTESLCERWANGDPNINYDLCVASLEPAPDHCVKTLRRMGWIALRLTRHNVSNTAHDIRILLKNSYADPFIKSCLTDCFELYHDAIATVRDVLRAYRNKRYEDANVKISSVMDASTTCEDGFKEREGVVSPVTVPNNQVFQLAAIALSIVNMLADSVRS